MKWFNEAKGYGFIVLEDGREAFVHFSEINAKGYRKLTEQDSVECTIEKGPKGLKAVDVPRLRHEAKRPRTASDGR